MIKKEFYKIRNDGIKLYKIYSDKDFMIKQIETNNIYEEAIDIENAIYNYEEINEKNEGTIDEPIPYNNNMELFEGLYYIQNEVIYKCTRSTGTPVFHNLSDLVGIYVEVVK